MRTLRERFNHIDVYFDASESYANQLYDIAKQMDVLLEECAAIIDIHARQDYGAQKLLAGFAPCEPDSAAIRLYDKLKKEGYGNDTDR